MSRETGKKDFRCQDDVAEAGFKFHMNNVSAAVGLENLRSYDGGVRNRFIAQIYNKAFMGNSDITLIPYDESCSYWLYTMFVKRQKDFMAKMKDKGIMTSRVHERNDIYSCVKEYQSLLPNLDKVVDEIVCLPCHFGVSDDDIDYIVECVKEGW
jgi:dTDP-4-amino-4,6-dideoxygalactose transaminase